MTRSLCPSDGRCQLCDRHVGRHSLVWDHCHQCGIERGWSCHDCNLALTEHIIHHWDSATEWLFSKHQCNPQLFPLPAPASRRDFSLSGETRSLYLGQGRNDSRFVKVATRADEVTVEQLAVFLAVTPGTARDMVLGRQGRIAGARKVGRTILVKKRDALNFIHNKWEKLS